MRPTTIRDARKMGLLPSVTNIISQWDKPQLTRWKMREAAKAALQVPPPQGEEPLDRFADRAIEHAMSQVTEAADLGSRIHGAIENIIRAARSSRARTSSPSSNPWWRGCARWASA